ncbi:MAG TPA: glycerophosphodiester phosphodiesterase family protein [Mycobacterium sp.]
MDNSPNRDPGRASGDPGAFWTIWGRGSTMTAGLSVSVWTAHDPADWAALTRAGVDGIITNTPAELLRWQQR